MDGRTSGSFEEERETIEREQSEIVDLEARETELAELQRKARQLESELGRARVRRRRQAASNALPIYEPNEPCAAPWTRMRGDERVRRCHRCRKRVYDLSKLSGDDARALVRQHEGELPLQLYVRVDGTATVSACVRDERRLSTPALIALASLGGASLAIAGFASAQLFADDPRVELVEVPVLDAAQLAALDHARAAAPPPVPQTPAVPPAAHDHHHHDPHCRRRLYDFGTSFFLYCDDSPGCDPR